MFSGVPQGVDLKSYVAANWIGPGTRERKKVKYNESDYYRNAMGGGRAQPKGPRLPKIPQMHDFQFFNTARLTTLFEKESVYEQHKHQLEQKRQHALQQGASEEQVEAQFQPQEDAPHPLTEEEVEEKDRLLEEGFSNWNKGLQLLHQGDQKHGRRTSRPLPMTSRARRLRRSRSTLRPFGRHKEILDFEKHIKNIEGDSASRGRSRSCTLSGKLNQYTNPWRT